MPTIYRLVPEGRNIDIDVKRFNASLPTTIRVDAQQDGIFATVASDADGEAATQALIDRELDRLFFLTCVRLRAKMCQTTESVDLNVKYRVHGEIEEGTIPLEWTERLSLQLKLWALAADSLDLTLKIILYFQIIELSFPDIHDETAYPTYRDDTHTPHPRTEAKLLRHLVAHAGQARPETEKYLNFLGLPPRLGNLTHAAWILKLSERIGCVEQQAQMVLRSAF